MDFTENALGGVQIGMSEQVTYGLRLECQDGDMNLKV